jgi:hypothetical protein
MFNLPKELQIKIFEYDSTYKDIYYNVLKELKKFGTFQLYNSEFESYLFSITNSRGIYIYSSSMLENYKSAFKKTSIK